MAAQQLLVTEQVSDQSGASSIQEIAQWLAAENAQAEPAITRIYLMPSQEEVRLVEVDTTVAPTPDGKFITPFYFAVDIESGIPYRSAIALIAPKDEGHTPMPAGWGEWGDAQMIWKRGE